MAKEGEGHMKMKMKMKMKVKVYRQLRKSFEDFLRAIMKSHELIAPVKKDLVRFEPISNIKDIYLKKNTYFPVKEYFFRKKETLFRFEGNEVTVPAFTTKKRAFFGIRRCDLNAIRHQDTVFIDDAHDPYYEAARKDAVLLGYHCSTAPSEYCFCGSLDLVDFSDIMFFDRKTHFLVEVGSEKGALLVRSYARHFTATDIAITDEDKHIPGADRLEVKDIAHLYDHPDWKKGVDLCLSCGACTALCPTCYCFSINDEVSSKNPRQGERSRSWSSCQVQGFTRVAGNFVFRKDREERFKHRIYHQLEYFKEKYGLQMCVGCGRCISSCPTRIDFVDIINNMEKKD